jgi:hypothetical protein
MNTAEEFPVILLMLLLEFFPQDYCMNTAPEFQDPMCSSREQAYSVPYIFIENMPY